MHIRRENISATCKKYNFYFLFIVSILFISFSESKATPINSLDASNMVQQAAVTSDLLYLAYNKGLDTNADVTITTTFDTSSWDLSVIGTYFGIPLSYNYIGDSSSFGTNSTVTWTGNGTYGTDNLSLNGSAVFNQVDAANFIISWNSDWMMSGNTVHQVENESTINGTNVTIGSQIITNFYSFTGEVILDGVDTDVPNWEYNSTYENSEYDAITDFTTNDLISNIHNNIVVRCNSPCTGQSQVEFIPEPHSLSLLAFGLLILLGAKKPNNKCNKKIS